MGIDNDSYLVFGWEIPFKYIKDILNEDREIENMPKRIYFLSASPYYDCENEQRRYFISLMTKNKCSIEKINKLAKSSRVKIAQDFIKQLGLQVGDPKIMSVVHIW